MPRFGPIEIVPVEISEEERWRSLAHDIGRKIKIAFENDNDLTELELYEPVEELSYEQREILDIYIRNSMSIWSYNRMGGNTSLVKIATKNILGYTIGTSILGASGSLVIGGILQIVRPDIPFMDVLGFFVGAGTGAGVSLGTLVAYYDFKEENPGSKQRKAIDNFVEAIQNTAIYKENSNPKNYKDP